jgi:hypothetical protein
MNDLEIFINGNVPSSKNGKRWTGKYLIHSKTTMRYIKDSKEEYLVNTYPFQEFVKGLVTPYIIHFKFYRKSRRKFDYVNPLQTVQDLMVKYNWLEDDSSDHLLPMFDTYEYSKDKPGVLITIKEKENVKNKKKGKNPLRKTVRLSKDTQNNNKSTSNKRPRKH